MSAIVTPVLAGTIEPVPLVVVLIGLVLITLVVLRVPRFGAGSDTPAQNAPIPKTSAQNGSTQNTPAVSVQVIIPARNEAVALPGLLDDLAGQTVTDVNVLVVDDDSTDDTAAVAAARGADVLAAPARPDGWNPKVWAMHSGVEHTAATGPIAMASTGTSAQRLVFLDADVRLGPDAINTLVSAGQAAGGLVSVAPFHCRLDRGGEPAPLGAIESLSAPFNVTIDAGGGPGFARHARGAVGSCLTMTRADYDASGGHAATPGTIVDDLALAATVRRAGLAVTLLQSRPSQRSADAVALVTVRSYPTGFGDQARGWIKNLSAGMGMTPPLSALAVGVWVAALVMPIALAVSGRWPTAAVAWILVAAHTWWLTSRVGRFAALVTSLGAPVLGVWFATVSAASVFARLTRRSVTWKGRALRPDGVER